MTVILWILQIIVAIIVLVYLVLMLIRTLGNNRKWKVLEPLLVENIEKSLGQRIVFKTQENVLSSPEADAREASLLWLAFTAEYVIFIARDQLLEGGENNLFMASKRDTSIMRVGRYKAKLEIKNEESPEVVELILMVRRSRYELLTQYIPEKRGNGGRW